MAIYGVIGLLVGLFLLLQVVRVLIPVVARAREQGTRGALDGLGGDVRADDDPIVKLALRTIEDAYSRGAESIHVAPHERSSDGGPPVRVARVSYRVDGRLEERMVLPVQALPALAARLRAMAGLFAPTTAALQRGRIDLRAYHPETIDLDLELASWRAADGDRCVLRLLVKGTIAIGLDALDLHDDALARLRAASASPRGGVLLVAGEVDSGRTTTLHAVVHDLEPARQVTFVAPDRHVPGVEGVDPTNVDGLDADVLVVGELRDPATARLAFAAAQQGQLILATIFARDVGTAIARLVDDLQVSRHVLPACLRAVVAQRLCRRVCRCRAAGAPPAADCERCGGLGYKGRVGLYEVAAVEGPLLAALRAGQTSPAALQAAAVEGGMAPLERDGLRKADLGLTDQAAVRAALA